MATIGNVIKIIANIQKTIGIAGNVSKLANDLNGAINKITPNVKTMNLVLEGTNSTLDALNDKTDYFNQNGNILSDLDLTKLTDEIDKLNDSAGKTFNTMTEKVFDFVGKLNNMPASISKVKAIYDTLNNVNQTKIKAETLEINIDQEKFDLAVGKLKDSAIQAFTEMKTKIASQKITELKDINPLLDSLKNMRNLQLSFEGIAGTDSFKKEMEELERTVDQKLKEVADKLKNTPVTFRSLTDSLDMFKKLTSSTFDTNINPNDKNFQIVSPDQLQHIKDFQNVIQVMASRVGNDLNGLQPTIENLHLGIERIKEINAINAQFQAAC
jgi:hypothetical protein